MNDKKWLNFPTNNLQVHQANAAIEQKYKIMKRTVQEVDCLWPWKLKFTIRTHWNTFVLTSRLLVWSSKSFATFLSAHEVEKAHDKRQYLQRLNR